MNEFKRFAHERIIDRPRRYGGDWGNVHLINDYFIEQGWEPLIREQHRAIASLTRRRNEFLQENEGFDHRTKNTATEHYGQTTIYDFLDTETALQEKKLIRYWSTDPNRVGQSNSRIKKSVRGVDDEHITAARVMLPLLKADPEIKQKRRRRKAPKYRGGNVVIEDETETNLSA